MDHTQAELEFEKHRLQETIALAKAQLQQAKLTNEENKSQILLAKKELRENAVHSFTNLYSSEDFEALAEMNQYMNPITNKLADYKDVEHKIRNLEILIETPYFARIDFKFDDEDLPEKIYIGRSHLKNDTPFESIVYDWRSPIASVFYRFSPGPAFYDAPVGRIDGEILLKRQYEIQHGVLDYYFDTDVQIIDEFLRKLLSHNSSSNMKTIVTSIQKEQDVVIRDMENDLMMVQGVAGSGKTSIALHRIAYLMYQGQVSKLRSNDIIIVSPNSLFEQYIANVIPELGEENVASVLFEEILTAILPNKQIQTRNKFLELIISNESYRNILKSNIEFKTSPAFMEIINRLVQDIPLRWIEFEDIYIDDDFILSKDELTAKLLGRPETPYAVCVEQLEDFVDDILYNFKNHMTQEIKNSIRKALDINLIRIYQDLFHDQTYFYKLAEGLVLPDCINEILICTKENFASNQLSYEDAIALAYLHLKIKRADLYKNIKQVVIDEAQDYYPLQYEIFNLLFKDAKYTILGDINQTLEKSEDVSLYHQIQEVFGRKKSSLAIMDKSFRCTTEILNYSSQFISQNTEIKSFNRSGEEPRLHMSVSQTAHRDAIRNEIDTCLAQGYQTIGLICKSEKNARSLFKLLKDFSTVHLVHSGGTEYPNGSCIIPVYMSKGLEFDAILICDADTKNYNSEDDKKLLYIASTRALHRLNLFCCGDPSPLIGH